MRVYTYPLFLSADMTQATLTSGNADIESMIGYAVQATYTGTATGNLTLQGSCDPVNDIQRSSVINWTTINVNPVAAPGSILINISDPMYRWIRLIFTNTGGGAGSLTAYLSSKGLS